MTAVDVLVVGAGPSGLAAATELRRLGVGSVAVIDREAELGGIPRHCFHTGFGWFDLRSILSGPAYARARVSIARDAGVALFPETTALGWEGPRTIATTSPRGLETFEARAIVLATGCRERARAARLVPGSRPLGVLTTGSLQQIVYGQKCRPGKRAVVVGAEHVSFSAVHTLQEAGVEVSAIVTDLPDHQTVAPAAWWLATRRGIPVHTRAKIAAIRGRRRVEAVEIASVDDEPLATVACDLVVFTGAWIPDHELARAGGTLLDEGTLGPRVDTLLRTSRPGVFAAGNLLRGAEIADVAALEGTFVARSVRAWLGDADWTSPSIEVIAERPLAWVCPNAIAPGLLPPRERFLLRVTEITEGRAIEVSVAGKVVHRQRGGRLVPNRPIEVDAAFVRALPKATESVTMRLAAGAPL